MRGAAVMAAIGATLAIASPAVAAWTELPPYEIPGHGIATCLRDAGDGRLAILGPLSRDAASVDVLSADAAGLRRTGRLSLGWIDLCAAVGGATGRPVLAAGAARTDPPALRPQEVRVAETGAPPAPLGEPARRDVVMVAADVAASGAAVVAWTAWPSVSYTPFRPQRVYARVRLPGAGAFGAVQDLGRAAVDGVPPRVGIADDGTATVAWTQQARYDAPSREVIRTSDAHGTFGTRTELPGARWGGPLGLAVAADGRALILAVTDEGLTAFERAAGDGGLIATPIAGGGGVAGSPAVDLAPDGSAVIAWRTVGDGTRAALRPAGGPFGPARRVLADVHPGALGVTFSEIWTSAGTRRPVPPTDLEGTALSATIGAEGTVAIAWLEEGGRVSAPRVRIARGTIADGIGRPVALGSRCRPTTAVRTLRLADGRLAVAWAENLTRTNLGAEEPAGQGRIRIAVEGAPETPAPTAGARRRVHARVVEPRALRPGGRLRVELRCRTGPCEVRVSAPVRPLTDQDVRTRAVADVVLADGATRVVELDPGPAASFVPRRGRRAIAVLACTDDGRLADRHVIRAWLRARPPRPLARPVEVRAVRSGDAIDVRWRTTHAARNTRFSVIARPVRSPRSGALVRGRGRSRFAVRLQPPHPARARTVVIHAMNLRSGRTASATTIIRGG